MIQDTKRLADLIRRKHEVLMQLRELGRRQADLVASGDTASLLNLLAVKQQQIEKLHDIEQELKPRYAEDPESRNWPSAELKSACARQAAECNELLREIVSLEKSSADRMTIRRNEVAQQLQQVHAAAQVRGAYEAQRRIHTSQ